MLTSKEINSTPFTYNGSLHSVKVSKLEREIWVQYVNDTCYEAYTNGGSYGTFKTFGKALLFAEKQLNSSILNNQE